MAGNAVRPGSEELAQSVRRANTGRTTYCVFNKTRESFLGLRIARADTHLSRLKGLMGRIRLKSDEGVWLVPSQGVHTIGVLFPIDLVYLDVENRVVDTRESVGSFRIGPLRLKCASVLELPMRTVYFSETQKGDELLICSLDELARYYTRQL